MLSVILITSDDYNSIRKTIGYLKKQTIRADIELVIVAPSWSSLGLDTDDVSIFRSYQVVEIGAIASIGSAYAAGIRAANAPIVALGEDHCFPEPDWAQAFVKAHEKPYAAVGPALRNANPSTATSWADMLIAYAQWLDPVESQTINFLPGHNSSYKRSLLLEYGEQLDDMMESETLLHWDLRSRGYELYLDAHAKAAHTNFARLWLWIPIQFRSGRVFAASRAQVEQWTVSKRLLYILASPLIPMVRLVRIVQALSQGDRRSVKLPAGTLFVTLLGLIADGLGQLVGYGFGHGTTLQDYADAEFHRELHLAKSDRANMELS